MLVSDLRDIINSPLSSDAQRAAAQEELIALATAAEAKTEAKTEAEPTQMQSGVQCKSMEEMLAPMLSYQPTPEEAAKEQERQRIQRDQYAKRASAECSHAIGVLHGGIGYNGQRDQKSNQIKQEVEPYRPIHPSQRLGVDVSFLPQQDQGDTL